jgi:acetyltransferase-like isoleucine patch superfamily enzyme
MRCKPSLGALLIALLFVFLVVGPLSCPASAAGLVAQVKKLCQGRASLDLPVTRTLASMRNQWDRMKELSLAEMAKKGASRAFSNASNVVKLRNVTQLGKGVKSMGSPVIDNLGHIELGDFVLMDSRIKPVHFNVAAGAKLTVGNDTFMNSGVWIGCQKQVTIGNRVLLAPDVTILDNNYHDVYDRKVIPPSDPVIIEDDVWIATKSTILPGVRIGRGSIVAANTVVNRDVPPFSIVAGSPMRVIRKLDPAKFKINGVPIDLAEPQEGVMIEPQEK